MAAPKTPPPSTGGYHVHEAPPAEEPEAPPAPKAPAGPTLIERVDALLGQVNQFRALATSHADVDRLNSIHDDLCQLRVAIQEG